MGLGTTLTINNNTNSQITYVSGIIVVPASGSVTVKDSFIAFLIFDANFCSDLVMNNVSIEDAADTIYTQGAATDYIFDRWVTGKPANLSNDHLIYTLTKQSFFLYVDQSFSNTNETPILYLKNPNSSSFKMRLTNILVSGDSTQGIITTRFYTNPTTTANGSSVTPQNSFVADSTTSALNCFTGPTVTSNGTKLLPFVINSPGSLPLNMKQSLILPPGNQILITGQAANLGLLTSITSHYFMQWIEI